MADTTARDALERSLKTTLGAWLPTMSHDELRIVDAVVTEVLMRRERAGDEVVACPIADHVDKGDVCELCEAFAHDMDDGEGGNCPHGAPVDEVCSACDAITEEFLDRKLAR